MKRFKQYALGALITGLFLASMPTQSHASGYLGTGSRSGYIGSGSYSETTTSAATTSGETSTANEDSPTFGSGGFDTEENDCVQESGWLSIVYNIGTLGSGW
jgi:hypothetical protein